MPTAEIDVTPDLVHRLLMEQHPDLLRGRELTMLANGWDNAILRLGDDLLVRLPRREMAAGLIEHEQAWLPRLADRLPAAVPAPVRVGLPTVDYPWRWSVVDWLPGRELGAVPSADRATVARRLGAFLAALHTPADDDVWRSPYRGGPLADRVATIEERLVTFGGDHTDAILARWRELLAVPAPSGPPLWVHGDVHPLNVLVEDGDLAAVIDWGDLTAGEPACDLAIAWLGFDEEAAADLRAAYDDAATHGLDLDALWLRAEAWAFHLSTMLLSNSDDHPELAAIGQHAFHRVYRK